MDYSNFAPHPQPYQFFVPQKAGPPYTTQEENHFDPLDAFSHPSAYHQFFDQNAHFSQAPINIPPAPAQSPAQSLPRTSISHALPPDRSNSLPTDTNIMNQEIDYDQAQGRSSDDEKESLTPAQSRRKAQNRAAQRAFRERKERHVKDLELKLKSMEASSAGLLSDNERLKREIERVETQNEILRATSNSSTNQLHRSSSSRSRHQQQQQSQQQQQPDFHIAHPNGSDPDDLPDDPSIVPGPLVYSPRTFNAAFADHNTSTNLAATTTLVNVDGVTDDPSIRHRIAINNATGERLLSTGAAWEYIQNSELFQHRAVDLGEVVDRLKEKVVCDGAGPVFPESAVRMAIEESVGAVGDELI